MSGWYFLGKQLNQANMIELLKTFLAGLVLGAVFSFFKLPIPAPSAWVGVVGIIGVVLGYKLVQ